MGFQSSEHAAELQRRFLAFLEEYVYPHDRTLLSPSDDADRNQRELIGKARAVGDGPS